MVRLNIKKLTPLSLLLACLFLITAVTASADSKGKGNSSNSKTVQAKQLLRKIERTRAQLSRLLNKVSAATKASLLTSEAGDQDTDSDGVSDDLEDAVGSNVCDTDSDDDGVSDSDEIGDDTDPENPGEGFFKAEGAITALSDTSITIGDLTCSIDSSTEFEKDDQHVTLAAFQVGDSAELKCSLDHVALKVEDEDSDDDDDHGKSSHH